MAYRTFSFVLIHGCDPSKHHPWVGRHDAILEREDREDVKDTLLL